MAERLRLSTFWNDPDGWAGEPGKQYKPNTTVTLENPGHAMLLRQAGYEAREGTPSSSSKPAAKKTAAKSARKTTAKKTAAAAGAGSEQASAPSS